MQFKPHLPQPAVMAKTNTASFGSLPAASWFLYLFLFPGACFGLTRGMTSPRDDIIFSVYYYYGSESMTPGQDDVKTESVHDDVTVNAHDGSIESGHSKDDVKTESLHDVITVSAYYSSKRVQREDDVNTASPHGDITAKTESPHGDVAAKTEPPYNIVTVKTQSPQDDVTVKTEPPQDEVTVKTEPPQDDVTIQTESPQDDVTVKTKSPQDEITVKTESPHNNVPVTVKTESPQDDVTVKTESPQDDVTVSAHHGSSESGPGPDDEAKAESAPDASRLHHQEFLNFTTDSFLQCLSRDDNLTFAVTEGALILIALNRNITASEEDKPGVFYVEGAYDDDDYEAYDWTNVGEDVDERSCSVTVAAPVGWVWRMLFHVSPSSLHQTCNVDGYVNSSVRGRSVILHVTISNS